MNRQALLFLIAAASVLVLALLSSAIAVPRLMAPGPSANSEEPSLAPTVAPTPMNVIAYWHQQRELVTQDLDTGTVTPIPLPEPDVKDFVISADLSTYAWVSGSTPPRVMVKVSGQGTKTLLGLDRLPLSDSNLPPGMFPKRISLSTTGALLAFGPLGMGVDGWQGGSLVLNTADGTVVGECQGIVGSTFSPNDELLAGPADVRGNLGPGVSERYPGVCNFTGNEAATATSKILNANIISATGWPATSSGTRDSTIAFWINGNISWHPDSQAIAYSQTFTQLDVRTQQCSATDGIVLLEASGAKAIYSLPTVAAGGFEYACPGQTGGRRLTNTALAPDGQRIVFEQELRDSRIFQPSLWIMNLDGSGLHKIADGTGPLWVSRSSGSNSNNRQRKSPSPGFLNPVKPPI